MILFGMKKNGDSAHQILNVLSVKTVNKRCIKVKY